MYARAATAKITDDRVMKFPAPKHYYEIMFQIPSLTTPALPA